jgi:LysM repeat protein
MPARSPARLLAPLALAVGLVAVVVVIATSGGADKASDSREGRTATAQAQRRGRPRRPRKVYVVRSGDLLATIAQRTGVSVERIQALNPDLDPQTLVPGQRIRLRP